MSENQILGESNRARKFDSGLADRLNKSYENRLRKEMRESRKDSKKKTAAKNNSDNFLDYEFEDRDYNNFISSASLMYSNIRGRAKWNSYWSNIEDKLWIMASLPDYYNFTKLMMRDNYSRIVEFTDLFKDEYIITNTKISYSNTSDNMRVLNIVHNFGSWVRTIYEPTIIMKPSYDSYPMKTLAETDNGIKYLQALFHTKDNKETILDIVSNMGGIKEECVLLNDHSPFTNQDSGELDAILHYRSAPNNFIIRTNTGEDVVGHSYGVMLKPKENK